MPAAPLLTCYHTFAASYSVLLQVCADVTSTAGGPYDDLADEDELDDDGDNDGLLLYSMLAWAS